MAWARGLLVLAAGVLFGRYILPEALPFVAALALALALGPVARLGVRLGLSPSVATLLVLALMGGVFLTAFGAAALYVQGEVHRALLALPGVSALVQHRLTEAMSRLGLVGPAALPRESVAGAVRSLASLAARLVGELAASLVRLPELALSCLLAGVALFFFVRDGAVMAEKALDLLPEDRRRLVAEEFLLLWRVVLRYLRAQLILMGTTAALVTGGLLILGERFSLLLGLAAGLLDLIPGLGAAGVLLPWALFLLATGGVVGALRLLVLLTAVVAVREVVESRVVGGAVGLHPLAALLAMYFGLKAFGPLGVAVGPILLAVSWAALRLPP